MGAVRLEDVASTLHAVLLANQRAEAGQIVSESPGFCNVATRA
jgi:hypothetical protein